MTLPLRQRHRRIFAVLGVVLPVAFAFGIAARKPVPSVARLSSELAAAKGTSTVSVWERRDLFAKAPVQVRLLRAGAGNFAVALSAGPDFVKPDLLVYWVAGSPGAANELPDNAVLLGAFGVGELKLPAEAASGSGSLVLFSLADQEIVDVSQPTRFNDSTQ